MGAHMAAVHQQYTTSAHCQYSSTLTVVIVQLHALQAPLGGLTPLLLAVRHVPAVQSGVVWEGGGVGSK